MAISEDGLERSINMGLTYLKPKMLNVDASFYLVVGSGDLWYLLQTVSIESNFKEKVNQWRGIMNEIKNRTAMAENHAPGTLDYLRTKTLWDPISWFENHNFTFRDRLVDEGSLNENEAQLLRRHKALPVDDECKSELLKNGKSAHSRQCKVSNECIILDVNLNVDTKESIVPERMGYVAAMTILNCSNVATQYEELINVYCTYILRLACNIAELKYPMIFRNYFMNDLLLCGTFGFPKFYRNEWLDEIKSWQTSEGSVMPNTPDVDTSTAAAVAIFSSALRMRLQEKQEGTSH